MNYEEVQRIYRLEKNTPGLTEIPPDFFAQAGSLLESVEERHKEALAKFFGEIIGRRRRKILLHALRMDDADLPPTNSTPLEEEFYRDLAGVLARHKQRFLSQKIEEPAPAAAADEAGEIESVRVLRALPAIVGADGRNYGPFREGDVVELPAENAGVLVKQGAAETPE